MTDDPFNPGIGVEFQAAVRSPEWRSALIVYEKYRRKLGLEHAHLLQLRDYVCQFAEARRDAGKPAGKDLLTQEASAYCKKRFGRMRLVEKIAVVRQFDHDLKAEVVRQLRERGTDKALCLVEMILWTPSSP